VTVQARVPAAGGFSGSFTWAALIAGGALAVTVYFTVVHRRRDKMARQLELDYALDRQLRW